MQEGNKKVIEKIIIKKAKGVKRVPTKLDQTKAQKIKIMANKGAIIDKNNIVEEFITPQDYEHIYNVKQDLPHIGKGKQNIFKGTALQIKIEQKKMIGLNINDEMKKNLNKEAKFRVDEGKVVLYKANESPSPEKKCQLTNTFAIAPSDYVQIFNAKVEPAGQIIPNQVQLQKALNDKR